MTDLEITRLCAEAMGLRWKQNGEHIFDLLGEYCPLHDDVKAMGLVKKFSLHCEKVGSWWEIESITGFIGSHSDLNRAICGCVARMQIYHRDSHKALS